MPARKKPKVVESRAEPKYRFKPILLLLPLAVVVVVVTTLVTISVTHRDTTERTTTTTPATTAAATPSPATPTPTASQERPRACPPVVRNGDPSSIENRAFDFAEANMLTDPAKRRKALETTGTPPRLVTKTFFDEELEDSRPSTGGSGDMTFVITRDPDSIDATQLDKSHMSVIIANPSWSSCRNGQLVNTWVEPNQFISTSWTLVGGVWYAEPGQA